jgi:2-phospho-L-lactate guanylyltransferase
MLGRTIEILRHTPTIDRIALLTPEPALGAQLGVETLQDTGSLNTALLVASEWAQEAGASSLLILPADLPLITTSAVAELLAAGERAHVVVAPTHDGGTGALLLRPPAAIPPSFGPKSYKRHLGLARERNLSVETVRHEAFLYDLDTPDDLQRLTTPSPPAPSPS